MSACLRVDDLCRGQPGVSACLRVDDLCRGQPGVSGCLRVGDTREVNQSATPPTTTELASTSHTSFDNGRMNDIMFTA